MTDTELMDSRHRCIGERGAAVAAGQVVIGHRLGLYEALAGEPATPRELADRTGCDALFLTAWLRGQVACGFVDHDPDDGRFVLSRVEAFRLADPDGPVYLPGAPPAPRRVTEASGTSDATVRAQP